MKSAKTKELMNKRIAYEHIDTQRPIGKNCVKISASNTDEHELMKYKICRQLSKEKKEFITECIFKNGKRADIVVPGDLKILEILSSETRLECIEKVMKYPGDFEVVMIDANQEFNEKLIY